MKRRDFVQSMMLGGAALPLLSPAQTPAPAPVPVPAPVPTPAAAAAGTPPVVTAPGPDRMTVLWAVSGYARGWVEYGETEQLGQRADGEAGPGFIARGDRVLRVKLSSLRPGTRYHAQAVTVPMRWGGGYQHEAEQRSPVFTFTPPDPEAKQADLAIWNDTHDRAPTLQALHALTAQERPGLLVWNGDVCNDLYDEAKIPGLYLGPAGGLNLSQLAPLCLLRGNHDVRGAMAHRLGDYTAMPDDLPFYALRIGPLAAIFMDTGEDKADDHPSFGGLVAFDALRRRQAGWLGALINQPAFRDAPYRVMFCHLPMRWTDETTDAGYDWFSKRSRQYWHGALVKWRTQVVISGHTHRHAWLAGNAAFPYAQLVGGGPAPEAATLIRLKADDTSLRLTVVSLQGRELDAHTLSPLV